MGEKDQVKQEEKAFDPKEFEKQYSERVKTAENNEKAQVESGETPEGSPEVEIDPEGFARSVGTLIAGFTGQDESFVEGYTNMTGTLLKVTGANKLQSFEMAFSKMPFLLKSLIFGAIMGVPAIALIIVNKKMKETESRNEAAKVNLQEEMLKQKFPPKEPDIATKPGSGVDRYVSSKKEAEEVEKPKVTTHKPEQELVADFDENAEK